jgi:hypothetical protein
MPHRVRKPAGDAFEVGENPVTPLVMQAVEGGAEELTVIHRKKPGMAGKVGAACALFRAFLGLMSSRNRALIRIKSWSAPESRHTPLIGRGHG